MTSPTPAAGVEGKTFLGHPRGLFVLFFAEMWERFSYYGMRALLIFYLVQHWLYSDEKASVIYGAYTALVYITPVIGGYLADRYLGQRKAVLFGAVMLTVGHFLMAFEGDGGQGSAAINIFWLALSFIIVGTGFLKANISVIVGQLYPRTDPRRDPAYTIFYMGINLGAALGAIIAGYLGQTYGWAYGFGAAGVGMLLGLFVFMWGKPLLMGRGEAPDAQRLKQPVLGVPFEWLIYILSVASVGVIWFLIQHQAVVGTLLGAAGGALVLYVLFTAVVKLPAEDRDRIFAAMFLIIGSILFWALFEQAGSSLNLFTDRSVDREILGWTVPSSMFQSINSIYIVTLGPLFAFLWMVLARAQVRPTPALKALSYVLVGLLFAATLFFVVELFVALKGSGNLRRIPMGAALLALMVVAGRAWIRQIGQWNAAADLEPSAPAKFGLAMVQLGAGFLVLVAGAAAAGPGAMTPVIFIFLIYLLHTTGELCLSPVGLSAMNRLSPAHMASLIMGMWFFASATGNFSAGLIAAATGAEGAGPERVTEVYTTVGWVGIAVGVGVLLISPLIKRLMHLDTLVDDHLAGEGEIGEPQAAGVNTKGETL